VNEATATEMKDDREKKSVRKVMIQQERRKTPAAAQQVEEATSTEGGKVTGKPRKEEVLGGKPRKKGGSTSKEQCDAATSESKKRSLRNETKIAKEDSGEGEAQESGSNSRLETFRECKSITASLLHPNAARKRGPLRSGKEEKKEPQRESKPESAHLLKMSTGKMARSISTVQTMMIETPPKGSTRKRKKHAETQVTSPTKGEVGLEKSQKLRRFR